MGSQYCLIHFYKRLVEDTMASRSFLAATRLMKNQTRGKALANWARPSIDEMGVPTESWKQVYDKNQSRYMLQLGAGLVAITASIFAFSQQVFMNPAPKHLLKN